MARGTNLDVRGDPTVRAGPHHRRGSSQRNPVRMTSRLVPHAVWPRLAKGVAAVAAGIALFAAAPARAQNASTPGTLELYPTFAAVGVRLSYSGDANLDATAHVEWRQTGTTPWNIGVTLTRITNQRW